MNYTFTLSQEEITKLHHLFLQTTHTTFDSREIKQGSFFVALKGESSDGNLFVEQALESGAHLVLTSNKTYKTHQNCFYVSDTLSAFWDLAHFHRNTFSFPILAIGGSNGKTTTKELLSHTLSTKYSVCKTHASFNNQTGVPLTLLSLTKEHAFAIIEVGANHLYEHENLIKLVKPTHLYVTNNGKDHLAGFGSEMLARKANNELFEYTSFHHIPTFILKNNIDQVSDFKEIESKKKNQKSCALFFGEDYELVTQKDTENFFCSICIQNKLTLKTKLVGDYNRHNIRAVFEVSTYFGISTDAIKDSLLDYEPELLRSQLIYKKESNNTLFIDCYNANPSSMMLSLSSFLDKTTNKKRFIILAEMRELGIYSEKEHRTITDYLEHMHTKNPFAGVFFIGNEFRKIESTIFSFAHIFDSASDFLESDIYKKESEHFYDAFFFFKGSRGPNPKPVLLSVVESFLN